jgi:cytochrome c556
MKKIILITFLFGILLPGIVLSSNGYSGQHHSNAAVRKYVKEHVMPVLQQKRQILEAELTPEERTTIAECRTALKQLHEQRKEQWSQRAPQQESVAAAPREHQGNANFSQYHQQTKEIMEKLDAVAAKHSNTLDGIKTDLEPVRQQWKADIQRLTPQDQNRETHHAHRNAGFDSYLSGNYHHSAARFLLLSATAPTSTAQTTSPGSVSDGSVGSVEINASADAPANPVSLSSFGVFPNPASTEIVTSPGAIPAENQLSILTMQGAAVMTLSNVQPSQHLDVSQLAPGNYVVQIKSSTETVNRQLVITR